MRSFCFLLRFLVFVSLAVFYHFQISDAQNSANPYTCKIDQECLDDLKKGLLEKETDISIYQFCKISYENSRNCCTNPSECQEDFGREASQILKQGILSFIQSEEQESNCVSNPALTNLFTQAQNVMCNEALIHCKSNCKNKLKELKDTFKRCFSVPPSNSIEEAFKKARVSSNQNCYQEMEDIADKYRNQSLSGNSLFEEDLKIEDIVDCEKITSVKTQQTLKSFSVNVCQQASVQKEEQFQEKNPLQTKGTYLENTTQEKGQTKDSGLSKNEALWGAGALAGTVVGTKALKKEKANEKTVQKQKNTLLKPTVSKPSLSSKQNPPIDQIRIQTKEENQKIKVLKASVIQVRDATTVQQIETQTKESSSKKSPKENQSNKSSSEKPQTVQDENLLGECPIAFSDKKPVVVYQSIEAPQIEPLRTFKTAESHYSDYDLVAGKPAVVLLNIKQIGDLSKKQKYSITLTNHSREPAVKLDTKCSKRLLKPKFELDQKKKNKDEGDDFKISLSPNECDFRNVHFRRIKRDINKKYKSKIGEKDIMNMYKFVELPTENDSNRSLKRVLFSVFIESEENKICSLKKSFFVDLRKTSKLHIDFMTFKYYGNNQKTCKSNEISNMTVLKDFAESKELTELIPTSYPIAEDRFSSNFIQDRKIPALCDNSGKPTSIGVLFDLARAEEDIYFYHTNNITWTTEEDFMLSARKLMLVVSEKYMKYHNMDNSQGFIIRPHQTNNNHEGGWNTAFIQENYINDGVVAHELAHLLGQEKEYYRQRHPITGQYLPDRGQYWCRKFSEKSKPCYNYRVFGGLKASLNSRRWQVLINQIPFMNNTNDLDRLWNDRETFQRLFRTLHNKKINPESSWNQTRTNKAGIKEKRRPSISLLGVYDKKKGKFYKDLSIIYERGLGGFSRKNKKQKGDMSIEVSLTNKHRVLSKVNVETDFIMEILSEKGKKKIHLDKVPVIARLPIPSAIFKNKTKRKSLRLIIRENFLTLEPIASVKGLHSVQDVSSQNLVSKKRKILYNAPIDWESKAENFFGRRKK